jgi:hypothetical protein
MRKKRPFWDTSNLALIGSGRQSKVYALSKKRVLKVGKGLGTYRNLWQSVLPRVFSRGRGYMVEERVKTYQEANFKERKILRIVESDFQRENAYIRKEWKKQPWYKRIFRSPKVYKKHAQPVLKKWGWGALSQYSLSNFHW